MLHVDPNLKPGNPEDFPGDYAVAQDTAMSVPDLNGFLE
jgi:hypothetical protein